MAKPDTDLVFLDVKQNEPVTDTLLVAAAFDTPHDEVMRGTAALDCSDTFSSANSGESDYIDENGKVRKKLTVLAAGLVVSAAVTRTRGDAYAPKPVGAAQEGAQG